MISPKDLHVTHQTISIEETQTIATPAKVGIAHVEYHVRRVIDLRNLERVDAYHVTCSLRLSIPNGDPFDLLAIEQRSFGPYPALLSNTIELVAGADTIEDLHVIDYAPKTMNTAVVSDTNQNNDASTNVSQQHTTGSTTAQTNTFGGSASLGATGDIPNLGGAANFEHSSTHSREVSDALTRTSGTNVSRGESTSMTIKDWGSYARIEKDGAAARWLWGQEYPWNAVQLRTTRTSDGKIDLPQYMIDRLYQNGQVLPPSELAQLGIHFSCQACWYLEVPANRPSHPLVRLDHAFELCTARHRVESAGADSPFSLTLDELTLSAVASPDLDLELLGLDPLDAGAGVNGAVIGFVEGKFLYPPAYGQSFRIASDDNNLLVRGTGFDPAMQTDFSHGAVTLDVYFKLLDADADIQLHLKHWKVGDLGATMTLAINGTTLTTHVDGTESSDQSYTSVTLRRKDFASVEYCDYLRLGLNTLKLTITGPAGAVYRLKALAIG